MVESQLQTITLEIVIELLLITNKNLITTSLPPKSFHFIMDLRIHGSATAVDRLQ